MPAICIGVAESYEMRAPGNPALLRTPMRRIPAMVTLAADRRIVMRETSTRPTPASCSSSPMSARRSTT